MKYAFKKTHFNMKILIVLVFSFVAFLLTSCETTNHSEVISQHVQAGECTTAVAYVRENFSGLNFYHHIAMIENECRNNSVRANQLLELTSRYGHEPSIEYLKKLNRTTPDINPRPLPNVSVSNPSPVIINTQSNNSRPQSGNINNYLVRTEEVIGARICHYQDGSARRIGGGMVCPPTN